MVVGLGNPGREYEHTFHNVGMMALERIFQAAREENPGAEASFRKHGGHFEYARIDDAIFVRPLVFMNESGIAVREALRSFGANPADLFVLHDESDLPVGEYKIVKGGSSAGHNGVQSIIDHIGTEDFSRVRIGIRNPNEVTRKKAGDFVLQSIPAETDGIFSKVFGSIASDLRLKGL